MLRHIVLLTWAEGTTPEHVAAVTAALDTLPGQVATIRSYTHGPDLGLGEGRCDYAIVADFDDAEGWRTYDEHPAQHSQGRGDRAPRRGARQRAVPAPLNHGGRLPDAKRGRRTPRAPAPLSRD